MSLVNSPAGYGSVAKTFHWLVAALILTQWPLGWIAATWPMQGQADIDTKVWLFSLHKTLGLGIFALALLRILWALMQPRPLPLNAHRPLEAGLAATVHWLLYAALVLVPLSGWLEHSAAEGFAPHWWPFGQDFPFVPKDPELAKVFAAWHRALVWLLAGALTVHVAGALKHHLIDRDATLRRMLPGQGAGAQPPAGARHAGHRPALAAAVLYALALGGATLLARDAWVAGAGGGLAAVPSGWTVQEGVLAITVRQMGSEVTGRFGDWTAAIEFSEVPTGGRHGSVEVVIAVPSLTLGGVSEQAMGRDFFNAAEFPTARFEAAILPAQGEGRYLAEGTLTVRGLSTPVALPFTLRIEGDTARMTGSTTLDRRAYQIGSEVKDPNSLGFDVNVTVELTATRGANGGKTPRSRAAGG